jgi:hypothetical protein
LAMKPTGPMSRDSNIHARWPARRLCTLIALSAAVGPMTPVSCQSHTTGSASGGSRQQPKETACNQKDWRRCTRACTSSVGTLSKRGLAMPGSPTNLAHL